MGRQNPGKKPVIYRVSLVENDTHRNLLSIKFNKPGAVLVCCTVLFILVALIYCLTAFTPIRKTIPGYPDAASINAAVSNAYRIDSLEQVITRFELYSSNLMKVLSGDPPTAVDSSLHADPVAFLSQKPVNELLRSDSLIRTAVMTVDQFEVGLKGRRNIPLEGMHFFIPVKGVVTKGFDPVLHLGVDIKAPENTVVYSIYDGTIIYSGWDADRGNVMIIQHSDQIISVYEHAVKLLGKLGDSVNAGTPIALVGSSGAMSQDEYLHFSLLHDGKALDPAKYINL